MRQDLKGGYGAKLGFACLTCSKINLLTWGWVKERTVFMAGPSKENG